MSKLHKLVNEAVKKFDVEFTKLKHDEILHFLDHTFGKGNWELNVANIRAIGEYRHYPEPNKRTEFVFDGVVMITFTATITGDEFSLTSERHYLKMGNSL